MLADDSLAKERFAGVEYAFEPEFIEGYSIAVKKLHGEGFVLTGNATEFLDPVFSSGVTFAVESGMQAAKLLVRQLNGEKIDWDETYLKHISQGVETFRTYVNGWYGNKLQTIFFAENTNPNVKEKICSVLAGYVWDTTNPFVRNHKNAVNSLVDLITSEQG